MSIEKHTKKMYDQFGADYQAKRQNKGTLFNEYLEVPCMVKAVGNIKGKKLLDVGCGAGIHIKKYLKNGADCWGIDLSQTMIGLAKKNCPGVPFKAGSMTKLPYANSIFDVVTASLSVHYAKNLVPVFKEISRVIKPGGMFYYSTESPMWTAREAYEDDNFKIIGLGKIINKKTGKQIVIGRPGAEKLTEWEMLPGMLMKTYVFAFRTHLQNLRQAGFELVDFIDCKPNLTFKKYDPADYSMFTRFPIFSIYVAQRKK